MDAIKGLAARIVREANGHGRFIVAIAGPPGSGKSTLADNLCREIDALGSDRTALVAMDGFHLDNAILDRRGLRARKGAPDTFDVAGYLAALRRLRDAPEEEIVVPVFDRAMDLARAGAQVVHRDRSIVVTEGNYLLIDSEPWSAARSFFDLSVFVDVDDAVLEARLIRRWLDLGHDMDAARKRALGNDLPNARFVKDRSLAGDIVWRAGEATP